MSISPYAVLYVDDDPRNLHAFRLAFRDHFRLLEAVSGKEALEILLREPVAVLVADQRMPEMTGSELCAETRKRFPDVVRMIVTAYSDIGDTLQAINRGEVARYIIKPWREEAMVDAMKAGIEAFQLTTLSRELHLRLLQREQQAATTFVLGRVLHEIVSPAIGVRDNLGFLVDSMSQIARMAAVEAPELPHLANDLVPALQDAYTSAESLVERIERFRQGEAPAPVSTAGTSLERAIHAAVGMVRARLRSRARLVLDLTEKPFVQAEPMQLSQIVVNLLVNASEAIDGGAPESNQVTVSTFSRGDRCGFIVEDTGRGISRDLQQTLFEPFASSKGDQGRGLGLAIVRDIVETLKGTIDVSDAQRGTRFTVALPRIG